MTVKSDLIADLGQEMESGEMSEQGILRIATTGARIDVWAIRTPQRDQATDWAGGRSMTAEIRILQTQLTAAGVTRPLPQDRYIDPDGTEWVVLQTIGQGAGTWRVLAASEFRPGVRG